ncbi:heterokaryon incompatibility domain-containing protein [Trichoderma compactum]
MARFFFRSLLRKPRVTIKRSVGFASLSFLGYTCYDHLYPRSVVQQQQRQNPGNSTLYTGPSTGAYPKLPDQRSIRLIKLYGAASPDDDIYTDLVTASIDKSPPYEALSYTWGNAQDAIRQLRPKPGELKYIWVDAICINQEDISEKSSQVSMMVEIYKKATRVDIWLGNGSDSSDFILKWYRLITLPFAPVLWIERKAIGFYYPDNPYISVLLLLKLCSQVFLVTRMMAVVLDLKTNLAHGEAELESKSYWTRVWTIQESITNPNCVILCGSSEPLHCDAFYRASVITSILRGRRQWDLTTYGVHLDHRSRINLANKGYHPSILRALCSKEATLEVDKIFAMRHKLPDAFGMLTPDYSQTTARVYTDAAHSLIEAHHNVQFIRFACHRDRSDGLPAWVPAWTATSHWSRWLMDENQFPAPSHPALVSKGLTKGVLKIKGLRVDTLTAKISDFLPRIIPKENLLRTFKLGDFLCTPTAVAILQAWVKSLSSTTGGDIHVNQFFLMISRLAVFGDKPDRLHQSLKSFHHHKDGSYNIRALPRDIPGLETSLEDILEVTDEQCCFLTTNGQVGLSTAPVCKGDEIVLLTGESLPYIIRKSLHQPGRYTVVSPCFLSNGWSRKSWLEWDWKGLTKQLVQKADYENWEYIELV